MYQNFRQWSEASLSTQSLAADFVFVVRKTRKRMWSRSPVILTARYITTLPAPTKPFDRHYDIVGNLYLQVNKKGKSWYVRTPKHPQGRKVGCYPEMSIAEARRIAFSV